MRASRLCCLALSIAAACGGVEAPAESAASAVSTSAVDPGNAGGNKLLTVMTRNLYLGAELGPAIAATTPEEFVAATTAIWAMVQKNDFPARAEAIADEIAAARPDAIGLQEVYTWRIQRDGDFLAGNPVAATDVVYDYLALLKAALARRGLSYRVAAMVELSDIEAPILKLPPPSEGNPLSDVRLTDHEVILVRANAKTAHAAGHVYSTILEVPVLGMSIPIKRGFVTVDVKHRGEWLRFASTHLESFVAPIRTAQAQELVAALAGWSGRLVLVGDMNSRPDGTDVDGGQAYRVLTGAGLADAWATLHPHQLGYTSSWLEDLTLTEDPATGDPLSLFERIDLAFSRGPVTPRRAHVVGDERSDRVEGLWPSDHAGVVATFRLDRSKSYDRDEEAGSDREPAGGELGERREKGR